MRFSRKCRGIGLLAVASTAFASLTQPVRAQTATPAANLVDQLVGPETHADVDIAALRQQAVDRIKSRADPTALERPPIAPQLLKLPRRDSDRHGNEKQKPVRCHEWNLVSRPKSTAGSDLQR